MGDPPGDRRFAHLGSLPLESGEVLPDVRVAFETWGAPHHPAVLVLHALTGDSHVTGWWPGVVGPGLALDTDRFHVVAANILGGCQGTTGPADLPRFPSLTVRDQVAAEVALTDHLGIDRWHAVIGGSAGGMRALEWAITHPDRVERLFLLATSAAASADQIGLSRTQVAAIEASPEHGLDLARRIAHLAYRSEAELQHRFGRDVQRDGRFAVDSYLQHHGAKLVKRFDPQSYVTLTSAMDSHDIGRGRGGVAAALARITARTVVAGIDSDRLYPLHQQAEIADGIGVELQVVHSDHGHDGFLVETDRVGALARQLLDQAR